MHLEALFILLAALAYMERPLSRLAGKLVCTIVLALTAVGLCSIITVFFVEAM